MDVRKHKQFNQFMKLFVSAAVGAADDDDDVDNDGDTK